ncbi:MAG: FAD-dependent oxidoreductase [Candidatus Eisenbacteria bacterium]|uniref:FAD-dependent oxidoreductase n=1 Tax=Eiseniibacteriota bacterium TaxID=2212470 RepID=A0A538TA78_UNCEI|nr:MAG: FAD-dependent oxidoreductase [Candidatus Eisenbacteria bacterium]
MTRKHVVVCGAGVVGLSSAYYLLERGHRVTIVERGGPDHDCCSLGNAGFISPSHFLPLAAPGIVAKAIGWMGDPESPFYVRPRLDWGLFSWGYHFWRASTRARARRAGPLLRDLNLASRSLFEELAEGSGNSFGLRREGLLLLLRTERGFEEERELAERSRELGMPAEVLDRSQVQALEPQVTFDVLGGIRYPLDAHLIPQELIRTLTRLVKAREAGFVWNAEVRDLRRAGDSVAAAVTSQGEIQGDEFVLAAGSWTPQLGRRLGVRLPVQPGKGYSMTLPAPVQLPRHSIILQEARVAITPMGQALRVAGTMEMAGYDLSINPPRIRGMTRSLSRYLPAFRPEMFGACTPWCGLRPCTPDGLPYLGRLREAPNVIVASGHAMMGVSLGPVTGKLVSEIVSGDPTSIDVSALRPERYG